MNTSCCIQCTREPVLKIQDLEGRIAFRHFGKMCCRGLAEVNLIDLQSHKDLWPEVEEEVL